MQKGEEKDKQKTSEMKTHRDEGHKGGGVLC